MSAYHLFAVDESGRSVHLSHVHGKPCLHIPDDVPITIILEHKTSATFIELEADGSFEVFVEEDFKYREPKAPEAVKDSSKHSGRRRRRQRTKG